MEVNKDEQIATMKRELTNKDEQIATMKRELTNKDEQIATMKREQEVSLKLPLQLSWKCGPDMPSGMSGYVQAVVVQGIVYVGGGSGDDDHTPMEYNTTSRKWAKLQRYEASNFAMTVINHQLVLVGGHMGSKSKRLGVWRPDNKTWTHKQYPDMRIARSHCSAASYNEWLVVAGGWGSGKLSSVEIMNTKNKEWQAAHPTPTPTPWASMRTAVVGDMCYFMGGITGKYGLTNTDKVYSMSLPALISGTHDQIWKELHGLQTTLSTPLSISGSLFAVGGNDEDNATTAIHHFQPDTRKWVKVGDLSTPRNTCACVITAEREMLVAGGSTQSMGHSMELAPIITYFTHPERP